MTKRYLLLSIAALAAVGVLVAAGCGGDEAGGSSAGNPSDRAFARAMVPHHEMAVDMARLARRRAQHPEIRRMAGEVIKSQSSEIRSLRRIEADLAAAGVEAGRLDVPEHMTGMDADMGDLERARPFDREFMAMMVPHHAGAIEMARAELRRGKDERLQRIARAIVAAQRREIEQMRSWSMRWYGRAPDAGTGQDPMGGSGDHEMGH